MNYLFLLAIVILLVVILSKINHTHRFLRDSINYLDKKLDHLKSEIDSKQRVEEKKPIKEEVKPIPIVEPEILKPVADKTRDVVADVVPKPKVPEKIESKPVVPKPVTPKVTYQPQKSWFQSFKEKNPDLEKFIGENLINKIGILILVLGVSYFVNFAIDKGWINEPARVGIGILSGSLVMFIAHKLKKNYAAFSSVLVAGAISIFYFTIAIAFHEYELFSQTVAFAIMVVITAFSTLVSVSYNRQELAVLSLIGGFAIPFMVSTGSSNYIVLFTYIAILNSGILAIAYFKKWRLVTILSFVFTCLLFASWVVAELLGVDQLPHLGAFIFATIFYFMFSITIVLNNLRNKGEFSIFEYIILIANTFFFFGIGLGIIHDWGIQIKGLFTLSLALYNLIYAIVLYKKFGLDKNAIYLLIGLTLTFVTLTIPIQFEGNFITLFWAAEAVLLFWLSQKSKIGAFKIGAIIVQFLSLISLLIDWGQKYVFNSTEGLAIMANPIFITGCIVLIALIATNYIIKKENAIFKALGFSIDLTYYRSFVIIVSIIVGYCVGILEISHQSNQFLANNTSALSLSVAYHFVFSATLLFFGLKSKKELFKKTVLLISIANVFLYVLVFYKLTASEMIDNFSLNITSKYAFIFHYIILACLIYFAVSLIKNAISKPSFKFLESKIALWIMAFVSVYVLSNEVVIHSLIFNSNISDYYELHEFKKQIIKIGYPILWGVLSFVFLIIGIKKQWKQLRIIALSLLGITILKLFIYDINDVSETGKIVAFILLGILILVISFVYQKIKKLMVDDTK